MRPWLQIYTDTFQRLTSSVKMPPDELHRSALIICKHSGSGILPSCYNSSIGLMLTNVHGVSGQWSKRALNIYNTYSLHCVIIPSFPYFIFHCYYELQSTYFETAVSDNMRYLNISRELCDYVGVFIVETAAIFRKIWTCRWDSTRQNDLYFAYESLI